MGTLAALLKSKGFDVRGSDQNVYPPMSDFLRAQGITLMEGYSGAWSFEPFAPELLAADDIAGALAASMHLIDRAIAKLPA